MYLLADGSREVEPTAQGLPVQVALQVRYIHATNTSRGLFPSKAEISQGIANAAATLPGEAVYSQDVRVLAH